MKTLKNLRTLPKRKLYYAILAVIVVVCISGGSLIWAKNKTAKPAAEEITMVRTTVVGTASTAQAYTYSGEVRGRFESQLAFQVNGKIIKRNVQLGSTVNAGDVLMQIDSRDLQQTVNSNSAQVSSAESQRRLAERNLTRYRELLDSGAISRAQYDQYASSYEVATASVQQASAQYSQGTNQLEYSLLRADKSGVVTSITAEMGQVVTSGQVVITVVQDGEQEVEISVPENRIAEFRKAGQMKVAFWALPNVTLQGTLREIAPMADQATRTFKVRISLINPPPEIKLGMTASVTLTDSTAEPTITIPLSAVYQDNTSTKVWVVKDDVLALRSIQTGTLGNGTIKVLSGLEQGDRIVTAGVHKLKDGQKVKVGGDSL